MVRCPWEYQVLIKVAKQEWKKGNSSDTERQGKSHKDARGGCVRVTVKGKFKNYKRVPLDLGVLRRLSMPVCE